MDLRQRVGNLRHTEGRAVMRWAIARAVNPVLYRCGFALFSDYFYQPLPRRSVLLRHRQACRSIETTLDEQAACVVALLSRFGPELPEHLGAFGYPPPASQLPMIDAAVLYGFVRSARPKTVIEIGSGASTMVIAAALDRNAQDGDEATFTSIDPFTEPVLDHRLPAAITFEHRKHPIQDVDAGFWGTLALDDIVFVDSSHVFKAGSDVEYEFCRLYPALPSGTLLHLHDIFLPDEYPTPWNLSKFQFWNEQQFLAVMLDNSHRYEVLAGLAALHSAKPDLLPRLIPGMDGGHPPGSIWLRVRGDAPHPPERTGASPG